MPFKFGQRATSGTRALSLPPLPYTIAPGLNYFNGQ